MKITILGPQGSGKSTQAQLLAQKLNLPLVDMGQLIRQACEQSAPQVMAACAQMQKGELVPLDFAANLLKERLSQPDCQNGFILDGYPRTLPQMQLYDPQVDKVFYLSVSKEESIRRLLERGRVDDTLEGISRRLTWFYQEVEAVLDQYKAQGILHEIDGEETPQEVFTQISALI